MLILLIPKDSPFWATCNFFLAYFTVLMLNYVDTRSGSARMGVREEGVIMQTTTQEALLATSGRPAGRSLSLRSELEPWDL